MVIVCIRIFIEFLIYKILDFFFFSIFNLIGWNVCINNIIIYYKCLIFENKKNVFSK